MMSSAKTNHLRNETSAYLLQHAGNPVEWYPWGKEALERARQENKPILLSIGYSACHWCHVMAHESFENTDIARLMNEKFINIKVDREERPDLDTIYMEAIQSITGSGGWPLTVFLTPEGKPFYGGTYFPPEDRLGTPGLPRILSAVSDAYSNRRSEIEAAVQQILTAIRPVAQNRDDGPLDGTLTDNAYAFIQSQFDITNGGFGGAPKFPQPMTLEFLMRRYHRDRNGNTLNMITTTLEKMARGGIYDQIGGGFHRYSTDSRWLVPHFEKMLYDNALLSREYLHAYQITKSPLMRRVAEETIDYILREMTSPEGGFYAAQDADSDGHEGIYYVWTPDEIKTALDEQAAELLIRYFGMTGKGNFEGRNILHIPSDTALPDQKAFTTARQTLLMVRSGRNHPARDEKVIVSWNGMMLASLAEAAAMLQRKDYLKAATANGDFMLQSMTKDGHLAHICARPGKIEGYLEDYAQVVDGFLNLHWVTLTGKWLTEAIRLSRIMIEDFWDESSGSFNDTSRQHERLFVRPRNLPDGAIPSGSSAATLALLKLAALTGDQQLKEVALRSLQSAQYLISQYPLSFGNWLCAIDFAESEPKEIVLVGQPELDATAALMQSASNIWLPNKITAGLNPNDRTTPGGLDLLNGKIMLDGRPTAYVCERSSCKAPITNAETLASQLLGTVTQ